eukprot:88388-Chlamydomonas_euryale.AAC.1
MCSTAASLSPSACLPALRQPLLAGGGGPGWLAYDACARVSFPQAEALHLHAPRAGAATPPTYCNRPLAAAETRAAARTAAFPPGPQPGSRLLPPPRPPSRGCRQLINRGFGAAAWLSNAGGGGTELLPPAAPFDHL